MVFFDTLLIISSVCYTLGWCALVCFGDASQLSKKMFHLVLIHDILTFPTLNDSTAEILLYVWNISCVLFILYAFYKPGFLYHKTYNPQRDNFPLHFLFPFAALAVPILVICFVKEGYGAGGLYGCDAEYYTEDFGYCTMLVAYKTADILEPLSFIPQLWVLRKLSNERIKVKTNIRIYMFLTMTYALIRFTVFLVEGLTHFGGSAYMWEFIVPCKGVLALLVGHTWIFNCLCRRGQFKDEEMEESPPAAPTATTTGGGQPSVTATAVDNDKAKTSFFGWGGNKSKESDEEIAHEAVMTGPEIQVSDSAPRVDDTQSKTSGFSNPFASTAAPPPSYPQAVPSSAPTQFTAPQQGFQGNRPQEQQTTANKSNDFSESWLH
mmetsp:Transcript_36200/g.87621  ORF Transcript_36200/g.87621 Transcript_36200/m.87621 type:complete len:379 (-) Transcript_36200:2696-3832(-)